MKVALITGVSGGIGKETALRFIRDGYFVVGTYNADRPSVENLIEILKSEKLSDMFFAFPADFNDVNSVDAAIDAVKKSFPHIDILVLNAGVSLYKLFQDTTDDEWNVVMNVNAKAPFKFAKAFLPSMISRKSGSIVFISSVWGDVGAAMETVYSQSKASLIGLTKALAKEVAPSHVRVNCVLPGVIDTKMNKRFTECEMNEIIDSIPLSRLGTVQDVAELIYFLCTEKSAYITGQIVKIDGGYTL